MATRSGNMMGVSSLYRAAAEGSSPVNLVMVSIITMMLMLMVMLRIMRIMPMTMLMITKPGGDDDYFKQPEDMRQHEAVGEAVGHVEVGAWIQTWGENRPFFIRISCFCLKKENLRDQYNIHLSNLSWLQENFRCASIS